MKIRYKIWLFILFITLATIISINLIADNVLNSSYRSLEKKKMNTNIERFNNALNNEINQLDAAVGDWSAWDDTYKFIAGEYNEFPNKYMDNATMTNLRTNVMIYVNTSGNIVYERGFDYNEQKIINVSSSLNNYFYKDSILVNFTDLNSSIKGIIQLPEGPILIASKPIITSYRQGPIRGSIIWGRYLDFNEQNFLSTITNLSVSINNFNDQAAPPDFREAALSFTKNGDTFVQPLDSNYVAGYSTIEDIFGKPVLLVKITMDRDIYKQGILTINYFQVLVMILGFVLSITLILFIDKTLLSRLNNFSKQVLAIGKKSDFSTRVKISGKDELNELANITNQTLQLIEEKTSKIDFLLKQKDEFINQLGHDLKNPLNPLINLLPIVEKNEHDLKNKEIINVLIRNVSYMKNLVTKTIELGRLNSPNTMFNFEDINLLTELNNVIENNKMTLNETQIEIKNNLPDNIIVQADKLRIDELITNLLNNAVKYTNGPGTITIDAKQDNDSVTVSMKDTGIGMNNEQLSKVFSEFYKADLSRHDFDSSGLGLSICKRIVERHGGKIWVESEGLGKGSTFYFTVLKSKLKKESESMEYIYHEIDSMYIKKLKLEK